MFISILCLVLHGFHVPCRQVFSQRCEPLNVLLKLSRFFRDDGTNHTFRGGRVLRKVPRVRQGSVTAHEPFTSPLDPKNNVLIVCLLRCILDLELTPAGRSWCSLRLALWLTEKI